MIIYSKTGTIILDIEVDDTSYRYRAIRQGDKVYLYFSLTNHVEIPIYSYINYQGQRYTLWKPENLTKHGERNLDYVVEFGGYWEILNRTIYKFLSGKPHKLKFPLTAKPRMFMQLMIDNLNLHDSDWIIGTCIDAPEKTLTFSHESCMEALNRFADEYNTEFEFIGKTINFGKVERFKDNPLPLSYGKGNGFKTGVIRQCQGEKAPVTVLYVNGGERNIDLASYGSTSLLLPKNQEIEFQGRKYKTDEDGMFITRSDRPLVDFNEDSYDATHIYPGRIGTVSEVITVDAAKHFYDIKDSSIPDDLDYSQCRIAKEKATIIFQSGILVGKEFDLKQTDDELTGYIHAERRFKIVPFERDGAIIPNESLKPAVGDKYAIFHISLPNAYICDNASQEGASWDMFREAVRVLYENEEVSFTFKGDLDGLWAKKKWSEIGAVLHPGSYIQFSDKQFQPDGILIRITGIKDYINKPHAPEIELSNTSVAGFVSSDLNKIDSNEVLDEERYNSSLSYTKRTWRDVMETVKMMFDPEGDYFTELIKPLVVHTAQLIVGTNSQQMELIGVKFIPNADNDPNNFKSTAGKLVHFTINEEEVREWNIPASSHRLDNESPYYVYAKCPKEGNAGSILVSERQIKLEDEAGYYHFWIGVLNTPEDSVRSWNPNYGFTEVAGQTITTGVIKDKLARLVIDLVNAHIIAKNGATISGKILFGEGTSGLENIKEWPAAKKIIDDAVREIGETSKALTDFEGIVNGAFKDGVIEQAEAKAIEKYINTLNTEKADADAVYTKLYSNIYLLGSPKTDLLNSKITYNGAHTELIKAVNDAIADGRTTVAEKNNVDSKFTAYKNAIADYKSKVEAANKAIQDTLKSYSDEALAKGKEAFTAASNAQASANQAQQSVSGLGNYIDGAFSDGIIQESEAKAIEKYINTVKTDKAAVEATYNKLYVNSYLTGTAKSGLLNAKVTLFGAIDNLLSAINSAISDGKTTVAEKNNVDSKFSLFNSAMSSFNTAVETANKAIQDTLKSYSDNAASNVPDSFKDSLAQRLGYTNYAALEAAADAGNTVVKNGKINTVLLEAAAIVAKGITAEMIEALDIETSRLKVLNGAKIGKFTIEDGWLTGYTSGLADALYNVIKLRHTKSSDGSFSQITLGSNVNNSLFSNQRVTARIYNGISNKNTSIYAGWGDFYRNTALQLEANYADVNLALETIGGRMHRGKLWEIEEVSPITGGGTYSPQLNGSIYLFRDLKADLTFELPQFSTIQDMFGNFQSGVSASQYGIYTIRIFIDRYCSYRVLVAGTSTTPLLNHNGDIQNDASGVSYGARWMSRGDFMVLVFYNKAWYIQSLSN